MERSQHISHVLDKNQPVSRSCIWQQTIRIIATYTHFSNIHASQILQATSNYGFFTIHGSGRSLGCTHYLSHAQLSLVKSIIWGSWMATNFSNENVKWLVFFLRSCDFASNCEPWFYKIVFYYMRNKCSIHCEFLFWSIPLNSTTSIA